MLLYIDGSGSWIACNHIVPVRILRAHDQSGCTGWSCFLYGKHCPVCRKLYSWFYGSKASAQAWNSRGSWLWDHYIFYCVFLWTPAAEKLFRCRNTDEADSDFAMQLYWRNLRSQYTDA